MQTALSAQFKESKQLNRQGGQRPAWKLLPEGLRIDIKPVKTGSASLLQENAVQNWTAVSAHPTENGHHAEDLQRFSAAGAGM